MSIASLNDYRRITHDYDNYDGDVKAALVAAQDFVEDKTDRKFDFDTYTESLKVHRDGRVYPHATPVSAVTAPSGSTISNSVVTLGNWGQDVVVNWPHQYDTLQYSNYPNSLWLSSPLPPRRQTVTYTGGFAEDAMPESLKQLVCSIAKAYLEIPLKIPAGASSVSVGGVSISGSWRTGGQLGQELPATVWSQIRAWRRREI